MAQSLQQAINNPITDKIWSVIREVTGHIDCPLCDAPNKTEALISFLDQDLSFQEISEKININKNKIKEHIKAVLQLTAAEIYYRTVLLKIAAQVDASPELLAEVKAKDIISAISTLTTLEKGRGKREKTIVNIPERLAQMSSHALMRGRAELTI